MDNKDFFDEEYEKLETKHTTDRSEQFQNWSSQTPQQSAKSSDLKPLYITLICFALVLCIALGWVLCAIFSSGYQSSEQKLFNEVLSVLDDEYYKKVDDAAIWSGIEDAGTALLQTAGDRFSRLMSPATYYNYLHPQSIIGGDSKGMFGMSFQVVEGVGMYISAITANSNAYGVLEEGDLIVKLSNINDGVGATVGTANYTELAVNQLSSVQIQEILVEVDSAEFSILRDGEIIKKYMERGILDYVNAEYPFEFVEFYFGDDCTNVSLSHSGNGPQTSVKEARLLERLANLPQTGYIRIDQFMDTFTDTGKTTASDEFLKAMTLFKQRGLKHLVLDLKGNPGGSVQYVTDIAGMLVTDSKLTAAQQKTLKNKKGELLITTLSSRAFGNWEYRAESTYSDYFETLTDKPDIVIWTDGGSASASELLTGALTDYGTAVQMGTTTYGKGIAQTIKELDNYNGTFIVDGKSVTSCWAVYYTVAEYFSPVTNTNIHGKGYSPQAKYNNLDTYDKLWSATTDYFKSASSGGVLA